MRIACWSGPRNLSTALMRAFAQRADTAVVDEPLYAAYLTRTGKPHPMRDAVIASQPTAWRTVADALTGPIPGGRAVWYQKHMAHHLLPGVDGDWLDALTHVFLIRDADEMLSSLLAGWPDAALEDTGLPQQLALFRRYAHRDPPVIDAADVLADPERALRGLCERLGLPWDPAMLSWPPGRHPDDGVWGEHWYAGLWASTGFGRPRATEIRIPPDKAALAREAREIVVALRERGR